MVVLLLRLILKIALSTTTFNRLLKIQIYRGRRREEVEDRYLVSERAKLIKSKEKEWFR